LLTVGTVVWLASELMFFGGLFAAYFTLRSLESVWPPADVTLDTTISAIATAVLISSSFTIHLAGKALQRDDRAGVRLWFLVTLALGAVFLANVVREFLVNDFSISSNAYGSIYYLMIGFHGLHVFAGLVLLTIGVTLITGPGPLARRGPGVESITYYWHFVDVVWIGLFTTIFIIR
jgi:cytochrome c oxidase subunit 3